MQADVLVVGGGIIGASILRGLAGAGLRATLIDASRSGLGATAYSGAMVRVTHPSSKEIAAAGEGFAAFGKSFEESSGRLALTRCGHLYFGTVAALELLLPQVRAISAEARIVMADEIAKLWPGLNATSEAALFEPDAGYADPVAFTRHQIALATAADAQIAEATRLEHLWLSDGRVRGAMTSLGRIEAKAVVLATGPFSAALLERHGLTTAGLWSQKIQVSRLSVGAQAAGWPGFIDDSRGLNGVPGSDSRTYHIGLPTGLSLPPEDANHVATQDHAARTIQVARKLIPNVADAQVSGALCHTDCYSEAPIGLIGQHPDLPEGLLLATGFSGGGFKMAPYAARRIVESLV